LKPKIKTSFVLSIFIFILSSGIYSGLISGGISKSYGASFFSGDEKPKITAPLTITTYPAGAQVSLDGSVMGKTPLHLDSVEVGSVNVRLERVGYPVRKEVTQVKAGKKNRLSITMVDGALAVLDIRSIPDQAEWWMDGRLIGVTPQFFDKIPSGEHKILVRMPGYHDWIGRFEAKTGKLVELGVHLLAKEFSLTVLTEPREANIRFLDRTQIYQPGILVEPGVYFIWVSHPGYEPKKGRAIIKDRDWVGHVRLKKANMMKQWSKASQKPNSKTLSQKQVQGEKLRESQVRDKKNSQPASLVKKSPVNLSDLLASARLDMKNGRLLSPVGSRALEKYQRILEIQPNHPLASEGLKEIERLSKAGYLAFVRIFPLSEQKKAQRFLQRIEGLALPGMLVPTTIKGVPYLRVCAGLFVNRTKAVSAIALIKEELGTKDIILRRYRASLYQP
jgi:hypothetical protein